MPGKGHRFTPKQDRQAKHIMDSEIKKGMSKEEAKRVAYSTVNKQKSKNKKTKKNKRNGQGKRVHK